jgi:hypothetical protein
VVVVLLRYHPVIPLERLRKTTENLSQESRSPGRDFNPGLPEYQTGVLTLDHDVW